MGSDQAAVVAGYCDFVNVDGDAWTAWYKGEQDGGVWGYLVGTGKFEGIQGEGTYKVGESWADGRGINYWDVTYTLPCSAMEDGCGVGQLRIAA